MPSGGASPPAEDWPGTFEKMVPVADDVGDEVVVVDVVLGLYGFFAPHGWSWRHELAQAELEPHCLTHCWPHSVHVWYGSVRVYSDTFGAAPLAQMQP